MGFNGNIPSGELTEQWKMAIEIVDFPINSMVDLSMAKCDSSPEGNWRVYHCHNDLHSYPGTPIYDLRCAWIFSQPDPGFFPISANPLRATKSNSTNS